PAPPAAAVDGCRRGHQTTMATPLRPSKASRPVLGPSEREWISYKPNPSPMTQNPYTRPHGHQPPSQELIALMELQLAWLSYHALELSVQRLLINLGYREVSLLSRTFLRGRTN